MSSLLIKGGRVLSPEDSLDGVLDLLVENGKIEEISPRIPREVAEVIDASGQVVAPGLIDLHAHLRVPGGEDSETFQTGLAAAVAGGFTTVCAMPNTRPVNDNTHLTRELMEFANHLGLARMMPIAAVSMGSEGEKLTDFEELFTAGAVAFSDDGRPVKTEVLMRAALERARPLEAAIIDHCEVPALSAGGAMNDGAVAKRLGVRGIPDRSEDDCVARDVKIAEETGGHVHIAHLSTAGALDMVRKAKRRSLRVTCEVTPHHFTLTEEAVEKYGTNAKMNPPLRSQDDLKAILGGIADGTVDVLATDHAPHSPQLKSKPLAEASFGIIGFETALALAITQLVHTGKISLAHLVVMMSTTPARIIRQPLGRLRPGSCADITIFDPVREWTYHVSESRSKSRNSPFDGWKLKGAVTATIVAGKIVYRRA